MTGKTNIDFENNPSIELPLDDLEVTFEDLFDLDDIQRLQDEFALATGVASIITSQDGTPITTPSNFCRLCSEIIRQTKKGRANCYKSDAVIGRFNPDGPVVQQCMSGGLWDAGAAISVGGRHIANWLIGQVRDDTQTEENICAYAKEIEADEDEVVKAFEEVPSMSKEQFLHIAQVLFTVAQQLSNSAFQNLQKARFINNLEKAETALKKSESLFKSYVESAPDGIFVADENGEYIEVNEAACTMTGYSRSELLGTSLRELIYPDDRDDARAHFGRVIETGKATGEFRYVQKNGSIHYWTVDAVKLSEHRFLGFAKDTTESRILAENLRQSEKMQAVGELAGGIAHDFNNQLAGIMGYADLLLDEITNNAQMTFYAENILTGAKRASELTSQLLAFSRKGKYLNNVVDIHPIVSEVSNLLLRSIDKKITMQQRLEANPSTVMGDPTQLQNILLNLALNARDAMPSGGILNFATHIIELDADMCCTNGLNIPPGTYLRLGVADNGSGMNKSVKDRIFEPFYTTKEQGKGTGMGLAAVYGTVRNHKGDILVSSEPGKGSLFELYLPVTHVSELQSEPNTLDSQLVRGSAHILVVDDEQAIKGVIEYALTKLGYTVSTCSNGLDGVDFYAKNWKSIDLVILDVVMPKVDGEETYSLMRKINPNIIALISSGFSIDGKAQNIIDMGANDFIQKPFRNSELSKKISDLLKSNKQ